MYEILYLRTLAFPVIIKLRVMGNLPSGYTRVLVSPPRTRLPLCVHSLHNSHDRVREGCCEVVNATPSTGDAERR
jgi:hypothetical protein